MTFWSMLILVGILFVCPVSGDDIVVPVPYSKRTICPYSKLTESERQTVDSVACVAFEFTEGSFLINELGRELERDNLTVAIHERDHCPVLLTVVKGDVKHRKVVYVSHGDWVVVEVSSPRADNYYAETRITVTLTIRGKEKPLLEQTTVTVTAASSPQIKPPSLPDESDLARDMLPWITGLLGKWNYLEEMFNASDRDLRRRAVDVIREVGNPAATDILEKRLAIEKSRSVKRDIKKTLKSLK